MNRKTIPPFLTKLYEIVNKNDYNDFISWDPTGEYFIIKNLGKFTEDILPRYFKHNNYSSFVRQLNLYDFHKINQNQQNEQIFQHMFFKKNRREFLKNIKRKVADEVTQDNFEKKKKASLETMQKDAENILELINDLKERIDSLEGKHDFLELCHKELASRNTKIKTQLKNLIEKEQHLENLLVFALKWFAPGISIKNDKKSIDSIIMPELTEENDSVDSTSKKKEAISKIVKDLEKIISTRVNDYSQFIPRNEEKKIQVQQIIKPEEDLRYNECVSKEENKEKPVSVINNNVDLNRKEVNNKEYNKYLEYLTNTNQYSSNFMLPAESSETVNSTYLKNKTQRS